MHVKTPQARVEYRKEVREEEEEMGGDGPVEFEMQPIRRKLGKVTDVQVLQAHEGGFTVVWGEPEGGAHGARGYCVMIQQGGKGPYEERGKDLKTRVSPHRSYQVKGLPTNKAFKVKIAAVNPDGTIAPYSSASPPIQTVQSHDGEAVEMDTIHSVKGEVRVRVRVRFRIRVRARRRS